MLAAERTFSLTFSNFDLLKQKRRRTTKAAAHVKRRRRERERLFTLFRVHNRIICRRLLRVCLYFARSPGLLFQRPTHVHTHTTIAPFYIKAWVSLSLLLRECGTLRGHRQPLGRFFFPHFLQVILLLRLLPSVVIAALSLFWCFGVRMTLTWRMVHLVTYPSSQSKHETAIYIYFSTQQTRYFSCCCCCYIARFFYRLA